MDHKPTILIRLNSPCRMALRADGVSWNEVDENVRGSLIVVIQNIASEARSSGERD
jgi:hypothetical protein